MARRSRSGGSGRLTRREANRLLEAAVGAIAFGIAAILAPIFFASPVLKGLAAALRGPGWLALWGGLALLALHKLAARRDRQTGASSQFWPRTGSAAFGSQTRARPTPSSGAVTAAARATAADVTVTDPPARQRPEHDLTAGPEVPATWTAAVFDLIEWRRFEAVCEWLFSQAGFETKTQSHGADGGIDIWLYSKNFPDGPVSVVQCKHWKSQPVKVAEVRALLGSMTDKKVSRGIFATTSTFSQDARQFAQANKIQLLDRTGLLELIAKRTPEQQRELLAVATKGQFWIPTCASCGVKMQRRSRRRDGAGFWGCVNYPRCKSVING